MNPSEAKRNQHVESKCSLQVRYEVVNTILRHPTVSVKLPTLHDLSARLGVSIRTVAYELKRLAEEGMVIGRRGIGTFTVPDFFHFSEIDTATKIVGIFSGDGQALYHDYNHWAFQSYTGLAIAPDIGMVRHIVPTTRSPELVFKELLSMNLDALVWILPPRSLFDTVRQLHENGLPTVTMLQPVEGVPHVGIDYRQNGRDMAKFLLEQDKTAILWCLFDTYVEQRLAGAKEYFAEQGVHPEREWLARNVLEFQQLLSELCANRDFPEAIYNRWGTLPYAKGKLETAGIDPYRDCCQIAGWSTIRKIPDFSGIIRKYPYQQMGEAAARIINDLLQQKPPETDSITLQLETVMI